MANLITSLWTGVTGMTSAQSGLNTTAHNLANINTVGYTRQQLLQVDNTYSNIGWFGRDSKAMQVGLGTTASTIRQLRDRFYDEAYRTEKGRMGFYEAQYDATVEIQDLFGEMEGVAFQESVEEIWVALEELSKEPESIVARATLVNKANAFLSRADDVMDQLKKFQVNLNQEIKNTVDRINELGRTIHEMNRKIITCEVGDIETANDYRDIRNNAIDELSEYVSITYKELNTGGVVVQVEGTQFVSELNLNEFGLREMGESDMYEPYWIFTGDPIYASDKIASIDSNTDIGSLKGMLLARGDDVANYRDIPLKPQEPVYPARIDYTTKDAVGNSIFDSVAYNEAVAQYEKDYEDYELEMNKFLTALKKYNHTVDTSVLMTTMARFDQFVHGITTTINDILAPNKKIQIVNDAGELEEVLVLDEENAPVGMDEDGTMGEALFNRKGVERYTERTVQVPKLDGDGDIIYDEDGSIITKEQVVRVYTEETDDSNYSLFTLGEIELNENILNDYSKIPLSENANGGDFSYTGVVQRLIDVWGENFTTLSPNTLTTYTFKEYYTAFIGDMGTQGNSFNTMAMSQEDMLQEIDNSRQNYAGVAQDEELSNLIKYQYSYNAASRYFTVVNEMLETLVALFS